MCRCDSHTIKKAEHPSIDAFKLWCWRRLLKITWTAKRSNQSILKENNPKYSLEGLIKELKFQYFGHLMWRVDFLENTKILGKMEDRREGNSRGWDGWMLSWLNGYEFDQMLGNCEAPGSLACCIPLCRKEFNTTEWLNNTIIKHLYQNIYSKHCWFSCSVFNKNVYLNSKKL